MGLSLETNPSVQAARSQAALFARPAPSRLVQRKCACGGTAGLDGECESCRKKRLQRRAADHSDPSTVPPIVGEVLNSPGRPLEGATRSFMEARFGHDFSQVRIHNDGQAAESARAVNALAYTVGRDVVFGAGQYEASTRPGRQLIAHELTHVIQQRNTQQPSSIDTLDVDSSNGIAEQEAESRAKAIAASTPEMVRGMGAVSHYHARIPIVARAEPQAVQTVTRLGQTARTGLQFSPTNITDTRVGPISVQGGLLSGGANRLHVILGQNMTLRILARELLPLWTTATPFTPPAGGPPVPLDIINEDDLARGLLVYNQTYLPVPAMTNWRSGLRFPLPVEIDEVSGVATLHPSLIRALSGGFDPAWAPLLDLRATANVAPPAATIQADVTAFLTRETTTLARGAHIGARALTNAPVELPFIRETFRQLGAVAFDVALAFMDFMVNRELGVLAAQREGAAILAQVRTALAAAPAVLAPAQRASLDRSNLMLGLVAGAAAAVPPGAIRARAEKTVRIDLIKLDGSTHNPSTDLDLANAIFAQCNVRLVPGVNDSATPAETTTWLGGNTDLRASATCGSPTTEERDLFRLATARFRLTARTRAFFVASYSGYPGSLAYSQPPYCATGAGAAVRGMLIIQNSSNRGDVAHELVHVLTNSGTHLPAPNLMSGDPLGVALTNTQCNNIYNNV